MANYLDELVQKITTKADLKGFDDLDRKQRRAIKSNDLLAKSFRRAFGIFFGIQGIRSIIQTTREFDLLQKSIKGLTGSVQDWEFLRQEADRTGTSLTKIASSYKNFYSAASMAGFNKNGIQTMFSDVLTAGRGIGASQEQIHSALVALEQMLSKGKVSAQELRLQMGNALPGSFEIAAKAMGLTTKQLDELMSSGNLMATDFLPKFTKELKNTYEKGFIANTKSLDAELQRLSNAWKEFQASILQGEAGEALAQLVRDITKILRSRELLKFIQVISKTLTFIIKNIRFFLLFFGINKIMQYINSFKNLHNVLWEIATTTNKASAATQALATSYAMLTSGQFLGSLKMLTKSLWAMCAPLLRLSGILAGVVSWFMILQDLWLFFTDKDADTITKRMMDSVSYTKDIHPEIPNLSPVDKMTLDKMSEISGKNIKARKLKNGLYEIQEEGMYNYDIYPSFITGYAANTPTSKPFQTLIDTDIKTPNRTLIDPDIKTPNRGYIGSLPNLNGNYNNSENKKNENNITIHISTQNSQPDAIAQSVEDALQSFFTKYDMGYG